VLRVQLVLAATALVSGILLLAKSCSGHGQAWSDLVTGEHLRTVAWHQVRLIPAYLLIALGYSLLAWPLVHRARAVEAVASGRGLLRRVRLLVLVGAVDLLLLAASLGPFFKRSPWVVNDVARVLEPLVPGLDLYVLFRWRLLEVATAVFLALGAWAVVWYVRAWVSALRRAGTRGRVLGAAPAVAAALACVVLVLGGGRPPGADGDTPHDIVVIASDSMRWDRLGVHGYERRDISPHIDAFSAEAADFDDLHVATASTLESWASFLAGQFPPTHGLRYMYITGAQADRAGRLPGRLPALLAERGYHTAVVSDWAGSNFSVADMGFERTLVGGAQNLDALLAELSLQAHLLATLYFGNPFGEWLLPELRRTTRYVTPGSLSATFLAELDEARRRGRPFFGVLFFSTTHLPYAASPPFNTKYVDPEYDGPNRYQIEVKAHELISKGFKPHLPEDQRQHIRNLYDGCVSEFDDQVGQVLAELRRRGSWDRTIVAVTSDHGEDLYDPGSTLGHGTNFFGGDQSTRVPFLIRAPGVTRPGSRIAALARNADFAPTVLSLLGLDVPDTYEGVDLTPLLTGEAQDLDLPVFAETCYLFFPKGRAMTAFSDQERAQLLEVAGAKDTLRVDPDYDNNLVLRTRFHQPVIDTKDRMVRTRRWKLVHIPGREAPIYRLYDLAEDPGQTKDLSRAGLSVLPDLAELLDAYWAGQARRLRWPADREVPEPAEPEVAAAPR